MALNEDTLHTVRPRSRTRLTPRGHALLGGGTDGNEVLTTATGVILVILLAALGITIIRIGQLVWEHLFIGLLLLGPLFLKMASTGYRFTKYYTGNRAYVRKGPPWTPLRLLAPVVVLFTLGVFATGVMLLAVGPTSREPWLLLHKATFVIWIIATAAHVLGHLPEVGRLLGVRSELVNLPAMFAPGDSPMGSPAGRLDGIRGDRERYAYEAEHPGEDTPPSAAAEARVTGGPGMAGRLLAISVAIVAGLILALVLIPDFHTWTHWMSTFSGSGH